MLYHVFECFVGRSSNLGFVVKDAPRNWSIKLAGGAGSCFIAGTQIRTQVGSTPIEQLQENDWVLTRGGFDEWGLVSDEKVVIPVELPLIHGIS